MYLIDITYSDENGDTRDSGIAVEKVNTPFVRELYEEYLNAIANYPQYCDPEFYIRPE